MGEFSNTLLRCALIAAAPPYNNAITIINLFGVGLQLEEESCVCVCFVRRDPTSRLLLFSAVLRVAFKNRPGSDRQRVVTVESLLLLFRLSAADGLVGII